MHYFVLFFIPLYYLTMLIFQGLHWSITLSIYGLIAFIGNLVFVFILGLTCLPESGLDRFYIVIVGITDFVGQVGVVLINKVERAATGFLLMESTDIIIVFLTQFLIFQVKKINLSVTKLTKFFWHQIKRKERNSVNENEIKFFWKHVPVAAFSNQSKKTQKRLINEALKMPRNILVKNWHHWEFFFETPTYPAKSKNVR